MSHKYNGKKDELNFKNWDWENLKIKIANFNK